MKIVFAKHPKNNYEYCWNAFGFGDEEIKEGDLLVVETKYGKRFVQATSGVLAVDEKVLEHILKTPIKLVFQVCSEKLVHYEAIKALFCWNEFPF